MQFSSAVITPPYPQDELRAAITTIKKVMDALGLLSTQTDKLMHKTRLLEPYLESRLPTEKHAAVINTVEELSVQAQELQGKIITYLSPHLIFLLGKHAAIVQRDSTASYPILRTQIGHRG
jgi:hypothetical protein